MARKLRVTYTDDLDGDEFESDHPTYRFGFEGRDYEIDLKPANGKKLEQALAKYIGHARRAPAARRRGGHRSETGNVRRRSGSGHASAA